MCHQELRELLGVPVLGVPPDSTVLRDALHLVHPLASPILS
jgi:hypothetical protein